MGLKKLNRKEIVGSKLLVNTNTKSENEIIEAKKLQSDPLYLLKKEQIHQRNKILLNEYKMKKIKESIKEQKAKKRKSKRKKKKKSQKRRDKKLKQMLLKSLGTKNKSDTDSDSLSLRSRSRSREYRKRHQYDERDRHRDHYRNRRHSRHYRSRSKSKSPKFRHSQRKKTKSSKKFGLIWNQNKQCGVKMDKKAVSDRKYEKDDENKRKYDRNEDVNDDDLLRQMMDNADEYDKHRRDRIRKYEKYQTRSEREDSSKIGATQSKYLSEMGTKLYMNHSDTLQSRLNKNKNKLLKKNQL